jgi:hypothetical protein
MHHLRSSLVIVVVEKTESYDINSLERKASVFYLGAIVKGDICLL